MSVRGSIGAQVHSARHPESSTAEKRPETSVRVSANIGFYVDIGFSVSIGEHLSLSEHMLDGRAAGSLQTSPPRPPVVPRVA